MVFYPSFSRMSITLYIRFEPDSPVSVKGIIMIEIFLPYLHRDAERKGVARGVAFLEGPAEIYAA
jgi:hypothetical protein